MEQLKRFEEASDELLEGKYLDFIKSVIDFHKVIISNPYIMQLLNSLLVDFNANKKISQARIKTPTKAGYFVVPSDSSQYLPMCFTLIDDMANSRFDYLKFIEDYFDNKEKQFINQVIEPFSNFIIKNYSLIIENFKEKEKMEKELKTEKYAIDISRIVSEMLAMTEREKKVNVEVKEDVIYLLNTLVEACKNEDVKYINALIIAFTYMVKEAKFLRFYAIELKQIMVEYYS